MIPITPSGTRIMPTWMPEGRNARSSISPMGSRKAAISRSPSAIAPIVFGVSVRRSTKASSCPAARAAATSSALAARRRASSRRIAAAIASSAAFLRSVPARASMRAAARAASPTLRMYRPMSSNVPRPGTLRLVIPAF